MTARSVCAVVMAGGKGTRMALAQEKPLLLVKGKPVVEHVVSALKNARSVSRVVVAVTSCTPKTAKFLEKLGVEVLLTPGKEYVSDLAFAVKQLGLGVVLAVAADLPLLTCDVVDEVVEAYFRVGKPALAVVVPLETKLKLGMSLGYAFVHEDVQVVPAGINVNDGARINEEWIDQAVYVVDKAEVAVNINTVEELRVARRQFTKRMK
jgi:adenosylcobinamide-phosphate guanylyltransferase